MNRCVRIVPSNETISQNSLNLEYVGNKIMRLNDVHNLHKNY